MAAEVTNLNFSDDGQEETRDVTFSGPQSNQHQRVYGIKRRRLDEHGSNGFIQSTDAGRRPRGSTNVPPVYDEPDDDH